MRAAAPESGFPARRAGSLRGLLLLAITALVAVLPASAARADEVVRVSIGYPMKVVTTRTSIPANKPLSLIITGTHRVTELGTPPRTFEFDALYCYKGCGDGVTDSYNLLFAAEKERWAFDAVRRKLQQVPPYSPSHRYKVNLGTRVTGYGRLRFEVAVQEPRPAAGFNYKYGGGYSVEIAGPFTTEETEPLRVNFVVRASGKPNLPLKGYPGTRTLVSSRVSGSGHATFTKKDAALLVATETKGSIVHEDEYSDGTKHTLTFGVVSQTRYYPKLRRLALVLKVKESNDPDCPAGLLFSTAFGTLTLLPHEDVALNGGTAIFVGVPKTTLTDPCRHAHGWVSSPAERVTVRILLAESKP